MKSHELKGPKDRFPIRTDFRNKDQFRKKINKFFYYTYYFEKSIL